MVLLLPALVPEVINTLKILFGRPEHILDRLIDKIRSSTYKSTDWYLSLISACSKQFQRNYESLQPEL